MNNIFLGTNYGSMQDTELLGRKRLKTQDPEKVPDTPSDAQVIDFISGGSDICGTSSSARRNAKYNKLENGDILVKTSSLTKEMIITFDEFDEQNIQYPHHDSLVISLFISNFFVRRILVDVGSSVNIIQYDVLKRMNISETEIIRSTIVLVGFSGERKNTLGEIKLPIHIEGVISIQNFCIIDNLSCGNIILGRPWIHEMKAVASTYHQCVKLPTPWGVVRIDGDQQDAKDCYTASMKSASKPGA